MSTTTLRNDEHPPEPQGIEDHEDGMIHELGCRLGRMWGYERNIAEASGEPEMQAYWRGVKAREQRNIDQLKQRIERQIECSWNSSRD